MECFEHCLRATSTYSGNGGEPEDSEVNCHITGAEVTETVDELQPEFLKAFNVSGPSWLQHCVEIGDSARVGSEGLCSNARGISPQPPWNGLRQGWTQLYIRVELNLKHVTGVPNLLETQTSDGYCMLRWLKKH